VRAKGILAWLVKEKPDWRWWMAVALPMQQDHQNCLLNADWELALDLQLA